MFHSSSKLDHHSSGNKKIIVKYPSWCQESFLIWEFFADSWCPRLFTTFQIWLLILTSLSQILFFPERGEGREKGRETSICDSPSCAPNQGPSLQPRHVPQMGTEPATPWFTGRHPIHWATPARAASQILVPRISQCIVHTESSGSTAASSQQ